MIVKISKEKVFWNTITDNKPTKELFDAFVGRMVEKDLRVNQDDILNITIVSKERDITYISIQHRDYVGYYYYNSIKQITNGAYVIQFKLDIWTTFTLGLLENFKNNNVKLKAIRNHILSLNSTNYTDTLLNNVPITWDEIWTGEGRTTIETDRDSYDKRQRELCFYLDDRGWSFGSYVRTKITRKDGTPISAGYEYRGLPWANGTVYYVFKETTDVDGKLILFPVLVDTYDTSKYNVEMKFQLKDNYNPNYNELTIHNSRIGLEEMRKDSTMSNKFQGIYVGQSYFLFRFMNRMYDKYNVAGKDYAVLTLPIQGIVGKNELIFLDFREVPVPKFEWLNFLGVNEQVPSLNYDKRLHLLASKAINLEYYGNVINPALYWDTSGEYPKVVSKFWYYAFTQQGFIKLRNTYNTWAQDVYSLPANLPIYVDTYLNYVNANMNQRDNQLNIYKQQMGVGIAKNIFGYFTGALSAGGKALSGDIGGAFSSAFSTLGNTAFGLADNILGYQNSVKTMDAQYADYKNTMGDEIQSGNINDALRGFFSTRIVVDDDEYQQTGIRSAIRTQFRALTKDTIRNLNNVLYLYGNYNPIFETYQNLQPRDDFNYLVLDKEYLTQIFSKYINNNVPLEFYELIINTLSSGVRLWKRENELLSN